MAENKEVFSLDKKKSFGVVRKEIANLLDGQKMAPLAHGTTVNFNLNLFQSELDYLAA